MQSTATTPNEYIANLPDDRRSIISELRQTILKNLPTGFVECISYGMLGYVVPHSTYPAGYHCDPKLPLPFINLASQKGHIGFYHMGIYANPTLLSWFQEEWPKHSTKKLDMGKSCIRFKKQEDIPLKLIAELCSKVNPAQWIESYENAFRR